LRNDKKFADPEKKRDLWERKHYLKDWGRKKAQAKGMNPSRECLIEGSQLKTSLQLGKLIKRVLIKRGPLEDKKS